MNGVVGMLVLNMCANFRHAKKIGTFRPIFQVRRVGARNTVRVSGTFCPLFSQKNFKSQIRKKLFIRLWGHELGMHVPIFIILEKSASPASRFGRARSRRKICRFRLFVQGAAARHHTSVYTAAAFSLFILQQ
jgi:hypothetical protein